MSFQEGSEVDPGRRVFVSYIDKSREYYLAQGYGNPYRWAWNSHVPFEPLAKPLAECRVGLVTTSVIDVGQEAVDFASSPPKSSYAYPSDPMPERLFTMNLPWDKEATNTDDLGSFFQLRALREFEAEGRVGSVSSRFYGVPTEYSQRKTNTVDAPEVLRFCREDGVDVALLAGL